MRKYKLSDGVVMTHLGELYRLFACRDFAFTNVRAGNVGGDVASAQSLSEYGDCWARGNAAIIDQARLFDNAYIQDQVVVSGYAHVSGNVFAKDNVRIRDHAQVSGDVRLEDSVIVCANAYVSGNFTISGCCYLGKDAYITTPDDFYSVNPTGYPTRFVNYYITFYLDKDKNIWVSHRGYNIPITEFEIGLSNLCRGDSIYDIDYVDVNKYKDAINDARHRLK